MAARFEPPSFCFCAKCLEQDQKTVIMPIFLSLEHNIFLQRLENYQDLLYNILSALYFARVSGARDDSPNLRKEGTMENGKRIYFNAEIEIVNLTSGDIVTASVADSFDYVDQNGWDS